MEREPVPFTYAIAGCVNGGPVALRLAGEVGHREVGFEVGVASPAELLLVDEQLLALVAVDPLVLLSLDRGAAGGVSAGAPGGDPGDAAPEIFRVESTLLDEGLKPAGRFVLAGCWSRRQRDLGVPAQIVEGWLHFEPLERVARVEPSSPMSILQAPSEQMIVATRVWSIATSRGNCHSGRTVTATGPGGAAKAPPPVLQERGPRMLRTEREREGRDVGATRRPRSSIQVAVLEE